MLQGLSLDERIEFKFPNDTSEPKTVFVLKPLSSTDQVSFLAFQDNGKLSMNHDAIIAILSKSIVEIKNFLGSETVEQKIERLPVSSLMTLIAKVFEINQLTKDEEKN